MVYWWEQAESDVKLKPTPAPVRLPPGRRFDPLLGRMVEVRRQQEQPILVKQDLTAECREDLVQRYNNLFVILLGRKLPLSYQEIEDFDQEFERVHDLYRLGLRRGIPNFEKFNGALFMFNSARSHLTEHQPYDSARKEKTESLLKVQFWKRIRRKLNCESTESQFSLQWDLLGIIGIVVIRVICT
jgi:hypothetical protein